jgi:hypothetical protein
MVLLPTLPPLSPLSKLLSTARREKRPCSSCASTPPPSHLRYPHPPPSLLQVKAKGGTREEVVLEIEAWNGHMITYFSLASGPRASHHITPILHRFQYCHDRRPLHLYTSLTCISHPPINLPIRPGICFEGGTSSHRIRTLSFPLHRVCYPSEASVQSGLSQGPVHHHTFV